MSYSEALSKQPKKLKGSVTEINESPNGAKYDTYTILLDGGGSADVSISQIKSFV